jgi:putative drug exporter of the RND superfamily
MAKRTFSAFVVEKRWWVIAGWIVLAALVMPSASRVDERLDVSASVAGSESARVQALIGSRFPAAFPSYAVVVISGGAAPTSAPGRALLVGVRERLSQLPFVTRTLSYLDAPDSGFVGLHGETYMVVGLNTEVRRPDDLVPLLRTATGSLEGGLRSRFPNISFRWTGEIPLNYDLRKASAADARQAERRVLPVTAILLVIAFGAVAAAVLPVFAGALSISLALGGAVILTKFFPLSLLLQNIVAMLGLGLGIDYALLVVGRFREALLEGMSSQAAAQEASRRAGHTIMLSGAVVAIAFASLLIVPVNEIRSIAVGGLLVIVVTVMLSTSLLPALLSLLGTRINAGKIVPSRGV